jgi:hypothetical protein
VLASHCLVNGLLLVRCYSGLQAVFIESLPSSGHVRHSIFVYSILGQGEKTGNWQKGYILYILDIKVTFFIAEIDSSEDAERLMLIFKCLVMDMFTCIKSV